MASKRTFYKVKGLNIKALSNRTSLLIISVISVLLYANTFTHDFALDDVAVISKNSYVQQGINSIPNILTEGSWDGFNADANMKIYRPFQLIAFALQYEFFELNPMPYHIFHVLSYALLNCLIFLLLKAFWQNKYAYLPFIIVLLFTVHPVHTDVVANIKGSADLFAMLFAVLAFLLLFRYLKHKRVLFLILGCFSYLISLSSKETAVTYLALFPIALYFFTDLKLKKAILSTMPYFTMVLIYLGIRTVVFSGSNAMAMSINKYSNSILFSETLSQDIGTRLFGLGKNLQLLFFPHPLKTTYVHEDIPIIGAFDFIAIATFFTYLILVVICILYFKKRSIIIFGIIYFLITISLFSNTVVMMPSIVSERWLLIPSLGFCIVIGALFYNTIAIKPSLKSFARANLIPLLMIMMLTSLYAFQTIDRNEDWKNDITLFRADTKAAPNNHFALRGYGSELIKFEETDSIKKGIKFLERSLEIAPSRSGNNNNIGFAYKKLGDYKSAIKAYENELLVNPNYQIAINNLWSCYNSYGILLMDSNKVDNVRESINYFKKATKLRPNNYLAKHNLGKAYYVLGDMGNAINIYEQIYKAKPNKYDSVFALGLVYNKAQQYQKALDVLLTLQDINDYKNTKIYKTQLYTAYKGLGQLDLAKKIQS